MISAKTNSPARRRSSKMKELTLREALERVNNPALASHLSVFFAELSRAQLAGDQDMVREAHRAIAEAIRGVPDGPIDVPLLPLRRKRTSKSRQG